MRLLSSPTGNRIPFKLVAEVLTICEWNKRRRQRQLDKIQSISSKISAMSQIRQIKIYYTLCMMLSQHFALAAIDWNLVKPMYLGYNPSQVSITNKSFESFNNAKSISIPPIEEPDNLDLIINLEAESNFAHNTQIDGLKAMDRIFGGNVATQFCFPYQVGLLLQRPRGLYWCGGSLISDEYVLTAAHCVDKAKRALVFLGAHEIKNAKEIGQVRMMVNQSSFVIFPTWNPRRLKDDIAIVRLPVPIEFNERIHPIPLPKRSYEYRNFRNKLAIASGWGRYASGVKAISGVLRFVKLRIVDGETCERSFPLSYRSTNICTSGKYEKSTCNGDSGGPLVLQRKLTKERILVGITSFGSIFGCDRGFPAAFTKVASYLDWISDETGIEPSGWKPDAELFSGFQDQTDTISSITDFKEFCAGLSDDSPVDGDDDGDDYNHNVDADIDKGDRKGDNDRLLYTHEQKYPDGTFLRTQFYHG